MKPLEGKILACILENPRAAVGPVAEIEIAPSGRVRSFAVTGGVPGAKRCLEEVLREVRFEPSERGLKISRPLPLYGNGR